MPGETEHRKGHDGARRAKHWLELTHRAYVPWIVPDPVGSRKLTFHWADSRPYSFDLGGQFIGEDVDGHEFLAESKFYKNAYDQLQLYTEFLAKCYQAFTLRPERCDHFLWITWSAFGSTVWDNLRDEVRIRNAVARHSVRIFGSKQKALDIPQDTCKDISERLWILVLSKEQEEHLVLTAEHSGVLAKHIREQDVRNGPDIP